MYKELTVPSLGDRTKHLKNLHGIFKPGESLTGANGDAVSPGPTLSLGVFEGPLTNPGRPGDTKLAVSLLGSAAGKDAAPAIVSAAGSLATSSAASLFTLTGSAKQDHSLSLSKFDPLDMNITCAAPSQETVSMSLDEVVQYAQPVADFF
jgi:hypothetical protein